MPGRTRRALRNSAIQGGSQVVTWALSWVLLVVLPRYLGDEGFGKLFLALSYAMVFGTLMNLGVNRFLVKELAVLNPVDDANADAARSEEAMRKLLGNVFALKLALSATVYAVVVGVALFLPYDAATRHAILIICFAGCINNLTLTAGSAFQGFEAMMPPNIGLVAEKLIATAGCTALLLSGFGLIPVCFVYVAAALVNGAVVFALLHRRIRISLAWNGGQVKRILAGGMPFLIWILFGEIYVRIDVLMLSFMTDEAVVGWYGAAFRIYATLLFVPHMLNTVVFPPLARMGAHEEGAVDFAVATRRVMNLLLGVAIPIGAGVALVAAPLVPLLYGEGPFENSIPSLRIFSACIVFVCVDVVLGSVLIAKGRQKRWSYMAIAAAVFNPLMNAWMIPLTMRLWQNGGIGAAVATLLTEILMMAGAIWLMPRGVLSPSCLVTAAKAAVSASVMAGVVAWLGTSNLLLIIGAGVVTYGSVAVAIRVLPPEDIAHMLHAAGLQDRALFLQRLLGIKQP